MQRRPPLSLLAECGSRADGGRLECCRIHLCVIEWTVEGHLRLWLSCLRVSACLDCGSLWTRPAADAPEAYEPAPRLAAGNSDGSGGPLSEHCMRDHLFEAAAGYAGAVNPPAQTLSKTTPSAPETATVVLRLLLSGPYSCCQRHKQVTDHAGMRFVEQNTRITHTHARCTHWITRAQNRLVRCVRRLLVAAARLPGIPAARCTDARFHRHSYMLPLEIKKHDKHHLIHA